MATEARRTEHGLNERVDPIAHRSLLAFGVAVILALFGLGVAGLGRSLTPTDSGDVAVVIVPRGSGRPVSQVQKQLENLGLYVEIRYRSNESAPVDTVTAQMPIGGSRLEVGKLVTLTVSDGPAGIQVPDAVGLQGSAALELLSASGLTGSLNEVFDDKARVGEVVATAPDAGSRTQPGSSVVLEVSKGPQPRIVPQIVGTNATVGFNLIGGADLQIGRIEHRSSSDQPAGTILSASPEAGEEVPINTPIKLVISTAQGPTNVPDVVGMLRSSAMRVAREEGFEVSSTSISVPPGDQRRGIVVSQHPVAGSSVPRGSTIEIAIGTG